jgi:hypothetical protein
MTSSSNRHEGIYPSPKQPSTTQRLCRTDNNVDNLNPLTPVISNPAYLQGYLKEQIGKFMVVNFLLGTSTFVDKEGILEEVGIDHIVLRETKTNDRVLADLYSIKFVEIAED